MGTHGKDRIGMLGCLERIEEMGSLPAGVGQVPQDRSRSAAARATVDNGGMGMRLEDRVRAKQPIAGTWK
jgi:hypothetical protein